jgi:predicted deacylase
MKAVLQIGGISAAPNTKVNGFINVPNTSIRMPITLVNGEKEGQTLLITAGIHGGEYPSIEAAIRFGAELDPGQVSGQIIVMSPVSLNAFHARQAFLVPEDGKNLNRQFPGKALGTTAERMAYTIMTEVVPHIHAWVDLHGGDIPEALVPFSGYMEAADPRVNERSCELAAAFGVEYVVRPTQLAGTTIGAAAALNIPALLAEAGQLGILDEDNTQLLLNGCRNVARQLGILPGEVKPIALKEFANWPWVRAAHSGCWYPQVKIGDRVQKDQVVGCVKDYFGTVLAEYRAPSAGLVLLVCVALSVNVNDPLVGIAE